MSFERTVCFSLFLHIGMLISLTVSFGKKYPVPDIYEVRLIAPDAISEAVTQHTEKSEAQVKNKEEAKPEPQKPETIPAEEKRQSVPAVEVEKKKEEVDWKKEYIRKQERLLALAAKKGVEKRVRLRETLNIEKTSSKGEEKIASFKGGFPSNPGGSAEGDPALMRYVAGFSDRVHEHYMFPDMRTRGIEAIITVIFLKDGKVIIKEFEKKSGNALFDQAVVRAIERSSPYKPPPYEFELGIRFSP